MPNGIGKKVDSDCWQRDILAKTASLVSLSNFLDTWNRVKETFLSMQEYQSKRIDQSESKKENIFSVGVSDRWPSESTYSSILK